MLPRISSLRARRLRLWQEPLPLPHLAALRQCRGTTTVSRRDSTSRDAVWRAVRHGAQQQFATRRQPGKVAPWPGRAPPDLLFARRWRLQRDPLPQVSPRQCWREPGVDLAVMPFWQRGSRDCPWSTAMMTTRYARKIISAAKILNHICTETQLYLFCVFIALC